jgi:hypothetical protein
MTRCRLVSLVYVITCGAAAAHGGIWQNVWRGLDLVATPGGSPLSQLGDGTRVNGARAGRLRIVPNGIGGGYQLELDRTFGADSRGRPETIHLGGLADITLDGATQLTVGYAGRGSFRSLHGDLTTTNLTYNLRSKTGAQDAQLVGTLNVANSFELNPLGFYTATVQVRNTDSKLFVNGVAVQGQQSTNFDIGPINLQGNVFYDATLGILTGLGVDTTDLEKLFPRGPNEQIDTAIRDALQQSSVVAGTTAEAQFAPLLVQAVTGDGQAAETLLDSLVQTSTATADSGRSAPPSTIPEPGTLVLMVLGASTLRYWRRR